MTIGAMDRPALGPGERETLRRRRFMRRFILASLVLGGALGGAIGGLVGAAPHTDNFDVSQLKVAPMFALVLALGCILVFVGLPLLALRTVDEMKVQRNLRGLAIGCLAVLGGYPAWQMLAAGGMLPQPGALGIFIIGYLGMALSLIIMKWRDGALHFQSAGG